MAGNSYHTVIEDRDAASEHDDDWLTDHLGVLYNLARVFGLKQY